MMLRAAALAIGVGITVVSIPTNGQPVRMSKVNGALLADLCRVDIDPSLLDPCNAFIVAATDAYQSEGQTCVVAPDAYVPVAVGVVRKYLKDHPEKLGWPAALLVRLALQEKFPCPTAAKK